jgi:hypothetical protein
MSMQEAYKRYLEIVKQYQESLPIEKIKVIMDNTTYSIQKQESA